MTVPLLPLLIAMALAGVHLGAGSLRALHGVPRSRWLSGAGGAAVAYVFLHLLPELAAAHQTSGVGSSRAYFLIALAGLVALYGVERRVRLSGGKGTPRDTGAGVFRLHVGSMALYSLVVGYLLVQRGEAGRIGLLLYGAAMGLHVLSSDFGMQLDHPRGYDRVARWILAAAILLGWLAGWLLQVPRPMVDALYAFLAGGVVLNVMKEELPEERRSRFGAFLAGVLSYGALLLALD